MNTQLNFAQLNAWQVLTNLGITIRDTGRFYEVLDPQFPDLQLALSDGGLIELSRTGKFVTGSLLDYLAFRFGNYEEAVDHLIHGYGSVLTQSGMSPMLYRDGAIQAAAAARDWFRRFLVLRHNLLTDNTLTLSRAWFRKYNIEAAAVQSILAAGQGKNLQSFVDEELSPHAEYVVFPFMVNPWTVAGLELLNLATQKSKYVKRQGVTHAYFGLGACGIKPIRVHGNTTAVCQAYTAEWASPGDAIGHVLIRQDAEDIENTFKMPCGVGSANTGLLALLGQRRAFDKFVMERQGQILDFVQYCAHELEPLLTKPDQHGIVASILGGIRNDLTLLHQLEDVFKAKQRPDLVSILQHRLTQNQTYWYRKLQLEETPYGLIARKGSQIQAFTNFLLRLDYNLVFPDSAEIFHVGRVLFKEREFPISIPRKMISRPKEIEQVAISVVAQTNVSQHLPVVTDETYRSCLAAVVNQQAGRVTSVVGLDMLGWAKMRDRYTTPTWTATVHGVRDNSRVRHPGRSHYDQVCSFEAAAPKDMGAEIAAGAWTAISLVVAMMLRSYVGALTGPIEISNDETTMRLFRSVLRALGQTGNLQINPNVRSGAVPALDGFQGFPVVLGCPSDEPVQYIHEPTFLPRPHGMTLQQIGSFVQIPWVADRVFRVVTVAILRNGGADHGVMEPKNLTAEILLREGSAAIRRYTEYQEFEVEAIARPAPIQGVVSGLSVSGES